MEETKYFVIEQKSLTQLATLVSQIPWNMADPIMKMIEVSFKEVKTTAQPEPEPIPNETLSDNSN